MDKVKIAALLEDRRNRLTAIAAEVNALDRRRQEFSNHYVMLQGGIAELENLLAGEDAGSRAPGRVEPNRAAKRAAARIARAAAMAARKPEEDA
jgi:hypothetical protein